MYLKIKKSLFVLLALVSFFPFLSFSNVSLKNGNFFIGYNDIFFAGGFEPKIQRVYNSKSAHNGWFGHGWASEYETYLVVSADASVTVHEFGGGAENRFYPKNISQKAIQKAVSKIVQAAKKAGTIGSKGQEKNYRKKLLTNATYRLDEWEKFRAHKLVPAQKIKVGTELVSYKFNYQKIIKTKKGYRRVIDNGRTEFFDKIGNLVKIKDKNNNFIKMSYNKNRKPTKMIDNFNRKIFFTFSHQGLLSKIEATGGQRASYKYNAIGELIYAKNTNGKGFHYAYSSDKHHNLVNIAYDDKTKMKIAYYGPKLFENVKTLTDRLGNQTHYKYEYKNHKQDIKVWVEMKDASKKLMSKNFYEYVLEKTPSGESWTKKLVSVEDGVRKEQAFNEKGLPIYVKEGSDVTKFKYDAYGRVIHKDRPNEVIDLKYHPRFGKVIQAVRFLKENPKKKIISTFKYDSKGNLIFGKRKQGKKAISVRLVYDRYGRVATLIDQKKRAIRFRYNEQSRPIQIIHSKLGSIHVIYDNSGEIKEVKSKAGRKIAVQVTNAFQTLLDIVRPAGVTLGL